jgi:hypothetical protein
MQVSLSFPPSDTGLLQWAQNVVTLITPSPATYNLVVGDVTTFTALFNSYSTALGLCDPAVRSKPAVVTKNAARTALKNGATIIANKVYSSLTVTDAQKTQLGMPPRQSPAPIPAPATCPVLEIVSTTGWTVRIRLRAAGGASRGRLPGTSGASIFSFVGATPPTDISAWKFEGNTGRVTSIDVPFDSSLAAGTTVHFTAFWFNGRKQSGPACAPISANLPGGSVSMAA